MTIGVVCLGRDTELVAAAIEVAVVHDDKFRGLGIRRQARGMDTFEPQRTYDLFRFEGDDIEYFMDELGFPDDDNRLNPYGSRLTREEAMSFCLRRMAYPSKLVNLSNEGFHAQIGALSDRYTLVGCWIFQNHTQRLLQPGLTKWADRVPIDARAVEKYTGIKRLDCFGFNDGASRATAIPTRFLFGAHAQS